MTGVWHLSDPDDDRGRFVAARARRSPPTGPMQTPMSKPGVAGNARSYDGMDDSFGIADPSDGSLDVGHALVQLHAVGQGRTPSGMFDTPLWKGGTSTAEPGYLPDHRHPVLEREDPRRHERTSIPLGSAPPRSSRTSGSTSPASSIAPRTTFSRVRERRARPVATDHGRRLARQQLRVRPRPAEQRRVQGPRRRGPALSARALRRTGSQPSTRTSRHRASIAFGARDAGSLSDGGAAARAPASTSASQPRPPPRCSLQPRVGAFRRS